MQTINVIKRQTNRIRPSLRFHFDYWMLLAVGALIIIGLLMVYSTTFDIGFRWKDDPNYYIRRQFIAAGLGFAGMIFVMQFDYHYLRKFSVPLLMLTLVLLVFVVFFGSIFLGAARGLYAGSYQPAELAKFATLLYIAHWLSSKGDRIKDITYGLFPFAIITGSVSALIVLQPDLSTATLLAIICLTVFFIAGADLKQFAFAGLVGSGAFVLLMLTLSHARDRFEAYKVALQDPTQAHWQVQQSLIALGTGKWFGVGIGRGTAKFGPLPFAHTDGVFAVVGEEMGLFGTLLVILLFALLTWRGFTAARHARDGYGSLLAIGITCWLTFQALINVAVITAVIPFTGMPMPFISYGGTSLAVSLVAVGVLLNISRDASVGVRPLKRQEPISTGRRAPSGSGRVSATRMAMETPRARISLRRRNGRGHLPRSFSRR